MLQQIQVKRVVPFYLAFLERFPTVRALAEAPLSDAIRQWGDLGRYRRVVNLHGTARIVLEEFGGEIPSDPEALVKLPGIGPYTAGAVACFAFERSVPFVDTNMRRVLHRLFFGPEIPKMAATEREVLALAGTLVPPEGRLAWEWNQAVMELGALVCTARKPRCEECPLYDACRARPKIHAALAEARGTPDDTKKPTYRYEGTNRYYRGRVLERLRGVPDGQSITLRALSKGLTEGDVARIQAAVHSLEEDGLAVVSEAPPQPRAGDNVAEERASYGGKRDDDEDEVRVRLP